MSATFVALSLQGAAGELLPGYAGDVHAGVCMVSTHGPRTWHSGLDVEGHGGWVLGLDWLMRWLDSFELRARARHRRHRRPGTAASPVWRRRATAGLPAYATSARPTGPGGEASSCRAVPGGRGHRRSRVPKGMTALRCASDRVGPAPDATLVRAARLPSATHTSYLQEVENATQEAGTEQRQTRRRLRVV